MRDPLQPPSVTSDLGSVASHLVYADVRNSDMTSLSATVQYFSDENCETQLGDKIYYSGDECEAVTYPWGGISEESVMAVYSNAECTQELGTDGFEQTRQAFEALPYMGSNCVPATGECFVLNAECRAAYKARFDHWEDEYGNEAVAIRISAWIGDATSTSSDGFGFGVCDNRGAGGCGGPDLDDCRKVYDFVTELENYGKEAGTDLTACTGSDDRNDCIVAHETHTPFYGSARITCDDDAPEVFLPYGTFECELFAHDDNTLISPFSSGREFQKGNSFNSKWTVIRASVDNEDTLHNGDQVYLKGDDHFLTTRGGEKETPVWDKSPTDSAKWYEKAYIYRSSGER